MAITSDQAKEIQRLTDNVQRQTREDQQQSMRLAQSVHDLNKYLDSLTDFKQAGKD